MLILLGGPDRVGKSTLAAELSEYSGYPVIHHSPPERTSPRIFECYYQNLLAGESQIWDRSYLCAYILERFRNNNHDHITDVVELELELRHQPVVHVGVTRPWYWSAPLHLHELKNLYPDAEPWFLRDQLMSRQQEHHFYTEQMAFFYQTITMFPSTFYDGVSAADEVFSRIRKITNGLPR